MNQELKSKLNSITEITLQNMKYLLEEQNIQIQKALVEILPPKGTITKDELWEILNLILSELDDVNDQVIEAKELANSVFTKAEYLQTEASETADRADNVIYSIKDLESTINSYKGISNHEAA